MFRLWNRCRAACKAWAAPEAVLGLLARAGQGKVPTSAEALQELWVRVLATEAVCCARHKALYIREYEKARGEVTEMFRAENLVDVPVEAFYEGRGIFTSFVSSCDGSMLPSSPQDRSGK